MIEQVADGNTVYDAPETAFVASFVGENNHFTGTVVEIDQEFATVDTPSGVIIARSIQRNGEAQLAKGDEAMVFIRPESLQFADHQTFQNNLNATVKRQEFEGNFWQVFLEVDGSPRTVTLSMVNDGGNIGHEVGARVRIGCNASHAIALPKGAMAAE